MKMRLYHYRHGGTVRAKLSARYCLGDESAQFGPGICEAPTLVWTIGTAATGHPLLEVDIELDQRREWVLRCDRIDFPPGGTAYRHTHPGPGIRCLLHGSIEIDAEGRRSVFGPLQPWFEAGPEPVRARASGTEPTAFVRVMLIPARWKGQRTIRYVDPADAEKPKLQSATIFFDQEVDF